MKFTVKYFLTNQFSYYPLNMVNIGDKVSSEEDFISINGIYFCST